jgi:hypothetical protein
MATATWLVNGTGNWTTGADWNSGMPPGDGDDAVIPLGTVDLTTPVTVNSITLSTSSAALQIDDPGQTDTVTTTFHNAGTVNVDPTAGDGPLSIGGMLTNSGTFTIGNLNFTTTPTVSAGGVSNFGTLEVFGGFDLPGSPPATFNINGPLSNSGLFWGVDAAITVDGNVTNSGEVHLTNSTLTVNGTYTQTGGFTQEITGALIAAAIDVTGGDMYIATDITAADSTGPITIGGTGLIDLYGGSDSSVNVSFAGSGTLELLPAYPFAGTIADFTSTQDTIVLDEFADNDATVSFNPTNDQLTVISGSESATLQLASANYSGIAWVVGPDGPGATMVIPVPVSEAAVATAVWLVNRTGNWTTGADWSTGTAPGDDDDAVIPLGTVDLTTPVTVNSITLSTSSGALQIDDPGQTDTVTTTFSNDGTVSVDPIAGDGPLSIGGMLTNSGTFTIGKINLTATPTVSAGGVSNTGTLNVFGGFNLPGSPPATFNINGSLSNSGYFGGTDADISVTGGLTNSGTFVVVDSTFTVNGTYTQTGGYTEQITGALIAAAIDVTGGDMFIGSDVTAADSTVPVTIGGSGFIELYGWPDSSVNVSFAGSGTLELEAGGPFGGTPFAGTIANFTSAQDAVALVDFTDNHPTVSFNPANDQLTVTNGSASTTLQLASANYSGITWIVTWVVGFDGGSDAAVVTPVTVSKVAVATVEADATALNEIVGGFAISDTAADIGSVAGLAALTADISHITSIIATDSQVVVGYGRFAPYEAALNEIVGGFTFDGQASVIQANIDAIAADASHINSITAENGTVTVSVATFENDLAGLNEIVGGFAISDTAADIFNGLGNLEADASHITTITATDVPVQIGAGKFIPDETVINKIVGGFDVLGLSANIGANFDAFEADISHIDSVAFADPSAPVLNLTQTQVTNDASLLAKITSSYVLNASSTGATTTTGHGNDLMITAAPGGNDTITGGGSSESFVFGANFGVDTIVDFSSHLASPGADTITLPAAEFTNFTTMFTNDTTFSGGNAIIQAGGDQLTIDGMTSTTLMAAQGDFKFV